MDLEAEKLLFNARLRFNAGQSGSISIEALGDNVKLGGWTRVLSPAGDVLGAGRLPFRLATQKPSTAEVSLRDLPACNEVYLKVESAAGWFELRYMALSAHAR